MRKAQREKARMIQATIVATIPAGFLASVAVAVLNPESSFSGFMLRVFQSSPF